MGFFKKVWDKVAGKTEDEDDNQNSGWGPHPIFPPEPADFGAAEPVVESTFRMPAAPPPSIETAVPITVRRPLTLKRDIPA